MASTLLALRLLLLLLLLLELSSLVCVYPLSIPLASLQDEHTDEHECQNGIACSQDSQAVFPTDYNLGIAFAYAVNTYRHDSEALDDIGDVYHDTNNVEYQ